jgi:hypothetical protein
MNVDKGAIIFNIASIIKLDKIHILMYSNKEIYFLNSGKVSNVNTMACSSITVMI